ncbi:hypothetical protein FRC08_017981 [Ceratobasidium sp. 394]|nr:hypothetical protein FRC08_017981 [Ceratobasidium sp. 394]
MPFVELRTFHSRMPNLEILRFDFDLRSISPNLTVDLNTVVHYRRSQFSTLEANFFGLGTGGVRRAGIAGLPYNQVALLVRYLFSLWPNVQITARADEDQPGAYSTQKNTIALINEHLAALSLCNRDASIKYEDIRIFK